MNRFLNYFIFFLTFVGAIFTLLQSVYLIWLRLGLFPFTPQLLDRDLLGFRHSNIAFIQEMITLLLMISAVEIALLWLLVALNMLSRYKGIIATLVLVIIVGIVSLFAFTAVIFEK